jgi:transcriptional regulator with XRE-family HTH domain
MFFFKSGKINVLQANFPLDTAFTLGYPREGLEGNTMNPEKIGLPEKLTAADLVAFRKVLGISADRLSKELQVSPTLISLLEHGLRSPSAEVRAGYRDIDDLWQARRWLADAHLWQAEQDALYAQILENDRSFFVPMRQAVIVTVGSELVVDDAIATVRGWRTMTADRTRLRREFLARQPVEIRSRTDDGERTFFIRAAACAFCGESHVFPDSFKTKQLAVASLPCYSVAPCRKAEAKDPWRARPIAVFLTLAGGH